MTKWISVEERLPDDDYDVLIFNPWDGIAIGSYEFTNVRSYKESDGSDFVTCDGWEDLYPWARKSSPTHWMPLPEAPTETI